jgi:hypothetical protein
MCSSSTLALVRAEHLQQHERVTAEDRELEQRAQAFNLDPQPPRITHLIAEQLPK